jgi:hypothetical protein
VSAGVGRVWPVPFQLIDEDDRPAGGMMAQLVQILGSLLVLAGFGFAQLGVLDQKSRRYLVLNMLGSGVLAVDAVIERQWGFLLLEGVWAIVSAISLIAVMRVRTATNPSH